MNINEMSNEELLSLTTFSIRKEEGLVTVPVSDVEIINNKNIKIYNNIYELDGTNIETIILKKVKFELLKSNIDFNNIENYIFSTIENRTNEYFENIQKQVEKVIGLNNDILNSVKSEISSINQNSNNLLINFEQKIKVFEEKNNDLMKKQIQTLENYEKQIIEKFSSINNLIDENKIFPIINELSILIEEQKEYDNI